MRPQRPLRSAYAPIFHPRKKRGAPNVGTTPPFTPNYELGVWCAGAPIRSVLLGTFGTALNRLFVYTDGTFHDVDVSDWAAATETGTLSIAAGSTVQLAGITGPNRVGLSSAANDSITAINVSNPASPAVATSVSDSTLLANVYYIHSFGPVFAGMSAFNRGLSAVSFSSDTFGSVNSLADAALNNAVHFVVAMNNVAFTATTGALVSVDTSSPSSMSVLDSVDLTGLIPGYIGWGAPDPTALLNDHLYMPDHTADLIGIFDVSNPSSLVAELAWNLDYTPAGAVGRDGLLFVGSYSDPVVRVYSPSDPLAPTLVGALTSSSAAALRLEPFSIYQGGGAGEIAAIDDECVVGLTYQHLM